uniref:Uncharacterized protein n=1 Tax=Stegastes partitus TaxID=144197 RepID=A0A3B4ZLK8_9TELE
PPNCHRTGPLAFGMRAGSDGAAVTTCIHIIRPPAGLRAAAGRWGTARVEDIIHRALHLAVVNGLALVGAERKKKGQRFLNRSSHSLSSISSFPPSVRHSSPHIFFSIPPPTHHPLLFSSITPSLSGVNHSGDSA